MNNRPQASVTRFPSESLIKPALAALAIFAGLSAPGAFADPPPSPPFAVDACGIPRGATGCTAEDIDIVSLSLTAGQPNPASCNAGDTITVWIDVGIQANAENRYNIGLLFAKDGGDLTIAPDGAGPGADTCNALMVPKTPAPFANLDSNTCGDTQSKGTGSFSGGAITVKCVAGPGGNLLIPAMSMWDQSAGTSTSCSAVTDLMPGTSSKCKISNLTVPITVVTPTGSVQLVKDIVPNSDTGKFNLSVTPSGGSAATATDVGDGGSVTKSSITAGTVVTLAESAGTGTNLANYTPSLACVNSATGASVPVTSNQITMPNPPIGIVCTYTNTRKSATLQLKKQWSNAKVGDTAALTATGITNSATAALNSTADSANELEAGTAVTVYAGEVATLGETVNPAANYTSTGPACTGTSGLSGSTLTVGAADTTIVCTYTNTRKSTTLQLKKQWSSAKVGDTAALTATGITNSAGAALNSTAGSADELDVGSAVTVYAGEVATLGETVNPAANYTSTGPVCTNTSGLSGSTLTVGAADGPIVCTYTNTRKQGTLQVRKTWVNAHVGDTASISVSGIVNAATAGLNSTANTTNETDPGTVVAMYAGETANFSESVTPSANYTSGFSCVVSAGAAVGAAFAKSVGDSYTMPSTPVDVVCTYTNTRKSTTLQLKKQWSNAKVGDTAALTATGISNSAGAALNSTADAANDLDAGSAVTVYAGEAATLGETVNPAANYTPTGPVCTNTSGLSGSTLTVGPADGPIVCTYTNTRVSRNLTLKKTWTNGINGDQVTVTTTGLANNATITSTSSGNNTDTGSAVSNVPGATVTLPAETFNTGSQSNYTTTVACTGATPSGSSPGATFTMPDNDVTCTYTNARVSRNLTLKKTWVNGINGDQVTVTTTGLASNATITSTSSGNNTDTGSSVSNAPGATVTLPAETFNTGSQSNYTTTVACTGVTPSGGSPGATFTMPDNDVTCTYTNTRKSATLQLLKTWVNARLGDAVTVTAEGITNSAGAALNAVANTANETDPGSAVTVYAGEAATLGEGTITGSGATYLKSFSCTGNSNALAGSVLTVSASDTSIVCTFTNEWLPPAPPPPQQSVSAIPATSTEGLAVMAALLALLGAAATRRRGGARRRG